jgi:protein disulfide-isomerase
MTVSAQDAGSFQVTSARPAARASEEKPYRTDADARKDVAQAKERARTLKKSVMVIFGANWCEDCVVLHHNLDVPANREYVQSHFEIVSVDVGQFNKNLDVAKSLGVDLDKGIPVAAFLDSGGNSIGNTNKGELEPSRKYHSEQILSFLREVVENRKITTPK